MTLVSKSRQCLSMFWPFSSSPRLEAGSPSQGSIRSQHRSESKFLSRNWIAFFLFGCINNLIYVVILSAAVDLVGVEVPKGIVLLADILPSLTVKTVAPYFIHLVVYRYRVWTCASLSFFSMVILASSDSISIRLGGVMMASFSSGLGEITFLMLSSFYDPQMVSAWSSGTGGAGLLGAFLFLALTSWARLGVATTLWIVAIFPIIMLFSYFILLTDPSVKSYAQGGYAIIPTISTLVDADARRSSLGVFSNSETTEPQGDGPVSVETLVGNGGGDIGELRGATGSSSEPSSLLQACTNDDSHAQQHQQHGRSLSVPTPPQVFAPLSVGSMATSSSASTLYTSPTSIHTLLAVTDPEDPRFVRPLSTSGISQQFNHRTTGGNILARGGIDVYDIHRGSASMMTLEEKRQVARSLLWPFMGPMFLVYFAEYTLNQGVLPVVLFPLASTPFEHLRDHYVTYSAIYQLGVFVSRSSAGLIQIQQIWIPSLLQLMILCLGILQALQGFIGSVWIVFGLTLLEGLLGGATYVHTYMNLSRHFEHDPEAKEFALGVVGMADGLGITLAGLASLWLEPMLCHYQVVERGIELCLGVGDP